MSNSTSSNDTDVFPNQFQKTQFESRDELLNYVFSVSLNSGYGVTIARSHKNRQGEETTVFLKCDRGQTYRNRLHLTDETRKRKTATKLIDCPFSLVGRRNSEGWSLEIRHLLHNHEMSDHPSAISTCRRKVTTEFVEAKKLLISGIRPREILTSLRCSNTGRTTNITSRDLYNERSRLRLITLDGRTPLEALLVDLEKSGHPCYT